MAKVTDELMDHEYDGIREYDNPMPNWWLWLFYATIVFALVYTPYYLMGWGTDSAGEYEAEMALAAQQFPARSQAPAAVPSPQPAGSGSSSTPAPVATAPSLAGNPEAIAAGKSQFTLNCAACHGLLGQGGIGPNLTDNAWLHGNSYAEIVAVIRNGVPAKGMVAWKTVFNPTKINQLAAFVVSIAGSNPPNPKAPQGQVLPAR